MDKIRNFKRRLIAAFFAFTALFHFRNNGEGLSWKKVMTALASPFAIITACDTGSSSGGKTTPTTPATKEAAQQVTVAAVPFSSDTTLALEAAADNYTFAGSVNSAFSTADLNGITYKLTSVNPDKTAEQLASFISNGKLSGSAYSDESPIITQTFYCNGKEVGSRRFRVINCTGAFMTLHDADTPTIQLTAIPAATLTLKK